jgi:hypothetical protein
MFAIGKKTYIVGGRDRTVTEEREAIACVEHLPVYLIAGSKNYCPPEFNPRKCHSSVSMQTESQNVPNVLAIRHKF